MPNFKKHANTGAAVGGAIALITNLIQQRNRKVLNQGYQFNLGELLLKSAAGAGIGACCGVLPDLLEPATSPHHRKFFHSTATAGLIGYGMHKLNASKLLDTDKEVISIACAGYLSHLLLDSQTSFGLPLVA